MKWENQKIFYQWILQTFHRPRRVQTYIRPETRTARRGRQISWVVSRDTDLPAAQDQPAGGGRGQGGDRAVRLGGDHGDMRQPQCQCQQERFIMCTSQSWWLFTIWGNVIITIKLSNNFCIEICLWCGFWCCWNASGSRQWEFYMATWLRPSLQLSQIPILPGWYWQNSKKSSKIREIFSHLNVCLS